MVVPSLIVNYRLDAQPIVEFDPGRGTTRITVRATATNTSETEDRVLQCASRNFWHVLDENHREVSRESRGGAAKGGGSRLRTETVAAGHSVHESLRVVLDNAKLVSGKAYTVRCQVWGETFETSFMAVEKPTRAPAKKSTARRKAPKKATARKAKPKRKAAKAGKKKATKKRVVKKRAVKKPAKKKATKKRVVKRPARKKATKKRATKKRVAKRPAKKKRTKKRT